MTTTRFDFELLEARRMLSGISLNRFPEIDPAFTDRELAATIRMDWLEGREIVVHSPGRLLVSRNHTISGLLGTFAGKLDASQYSVDVFWGDGTNSPGTVVINGDGSLGVQASHDYADNGFHAVGVDVHGTDGTEGFTEPYGMFARTGAHELSLLESPFIFSLLRAGCGDPPSIDLGKFYDIDHLNGDGSGYVVSVDWGNGQRVEGTLEPSPDGGYQIHASTPRFTADGRYNVTYSITRADSKSGGPSISVSAIAEVGYIPYRYACDEDPMYEYAPVSIETIAIDETDAAATSPPPSRLPGKPIAPVSPSFGSVKFDRGTPDSLGDGDAFGLLA